MTQTRATWIFQANPTIYDIHTSLRVEAEEYWNCNQHYKKIRAGDRVLIWIAGKRSGVYALGTVMSDPVVRPDSAKGQAYWTDPENGRSARPRVRVKYDRVFLSRPLYRDFLQCDPELWDLTILARPQGTNFAVDEREWQAIEGWLVDAIG
jgi:hypothetical protein